MLSRLRIFLLLACILYIPTAFSGDKLSPLKVDGATTIDAAKAKQLFEDGVVFIDVRDDNDWDAGRIPGAEHLELKHRFTEIALEEITPKQEPLVFYCNGEKCLRSSEASKQAVSWGFAKIYYFRDGYPAWKDAGYPVE